jgi:hypothetical protein
MKIGLDLKLNQVSIKVQKLGLEGKIRRVTKFTLGPMAHAIILDLIIFEVTCALLVINPLC